MNDDEILKAAKLIRAKREKDRRQKIKEKIIESTKAEVPIFQITKKYPIILADPPWKYIADCKGDRSPSNHYPTMTLEEICKLPVSELVTDEAMLFIWTTNALLAECFKVIEAWGFVYVANIVWTKDKIGLGWYVRNQHEILLMAKRGQMLIPEPGDRPSSVINAPRQKHSSKPIETYRLIEDMYPDLPRIELFARQSRHGWDAWGNATAIDHPFQE